jgi:hypothetical protein
MSDFRYEIKTELELRYLLSDWNIDWKSGSVRLNKQRTTDPGSRLVDPVDDEDVEEIFHELILQHWQCDLKKWKNISTHPIVIVLLIITFLLYIGLAIELIFSNIYNVITDYLPFVN